MSRSYTINLDPAHALLIELPHRGSATLRASRAFRVGSTLYAADFPHRVPERGRSRRLLVQTFGDAPATLSVREQ